MAKLKLSAVVFDCDGVLIETDTVKTLAFGRTVEAFGQGAMDRLMAYHKEHGGMSRVKKFEWFFGEVVKAPLSDEMMETLCCRFSGLCLQSVLDAPMVDGAEDSLNFLTGRLPMFVASGTPEKELQDVLSQRGLFPYFKGIHGTPPEKQYILEQIIRDNGLDASRVLMVGDAVTDLNAAKYCRSLFYGRGQRFDGENVPWGEDLLDLVPYLSDTFDFSAAG